MSKFCYMPFETMAIDTAGNVMPCCAFDTSHAPFNYADAPIPINEYFNSNKLTEIQSTFLAGDIPAGWVNCISKEKYGMKSKRQKWESNRKDIPIIKNRQSPIFVEVAVSNKCNVACTTCDSFFSSGWNRYDKFMSGHPDFVKRQELVNTSFKVDNSFMNELLDSVVNDKDLNIELIGGEPLFNKSVVEFLDKFSSMELDNNLTITTNCTLINDTVLSYLKKVKNLVIVCSIDAIGPLYNYIRDYEFTVVEENIKKLLTLDAIVLTMPVFSMFNVFNIPDLIMWHNALATKFNTRIKLINYVKAPYYASLENIPSFMVEDTIDQLKDIYMLNLKTLHQVELYQLINTLSVYKTFSIEKQQISLQWIEKCNIIREMDIEKIEPKLKEFVEYVRA